MIVRSLLPVLYLALLWPPATAATPDTAPLDARFRLRVQADAGARDRIAAAGLDVAGNGLPEPWVEIIADGQDGSAELDFTNL